MILSYSIISSIILGFCFFAYRIFMAGQRQHSINRRMLILIYAISLVLPFAVLATIMNHHELTNGVTAIEIGEIKNEIDKDYGITGFFASINIFKLLINIYLIGVLLTASYYLFGLAMLLRIFRKGERTEYGNFTLIIVSDKFNASPFCWGKSIVMKQSDYDEDGDMILIHEYAHLKLHHWTDLVIAYITICLQWYNPAAWAMREELKAIHEYQADETVIETGVNPKEYQMLLLKRAVGYGYQSLANSLNHSKLQNRVTMMYKKKTSLRRKLFALALVPAIGAGIAVSAIPSVAGVLESLATTPVINPTSSSTSSEVSAPEKKKDVFTAVQVQAEYPGGMQGLLQYLMNNIRYPENAMKNDIQGRVIVKFVIDSNGAVSDAEIVKGVDTDLDMEALRVVNNMPKWTPAKVDGKDVASYFTLPVQFKLQDDTPKEETN